MLVTEIVRTVIPYQSLDLFWRYLHSVEESRGRPSWKRLADILIIIIFNVHAVLIFTFQLLSLNPSPFVRFLQADMIYSFYDECLYIAPITLDLLASYFVYVLYLKPNLGVVLLHKQILESSTLMRRIFYVQANVSMPFVIAVDFTIIYWHVGYVRIAREQHYDRLFNAGALGYARLALHLLSSILVDLGLMYYVHTCLLIALLSLSGLLSLKRRIKYNLHRLIRASRSRPYACWPAQLAAFIRDDLRTFRLVFLTDRVYGRLFLAFMLLSYPTNAILSILIILGKFGDTAALLTAAALSLEQMICIFAIHLYLANFAKRAHASARVLLSRAAAAAAAARRQHGAGWSHFRTKLTLETTIARLHTKKRYGFTYGSLALISMDTFSKCVLLYGKLLMFSYKIIQRE